MIEKCLAYFLTGWFIHALYKMMMDAHEVRRNERKTNGRTNCN